MSRNNEETLIHFYHQVEDYFFASISQKLYNLGSCASAYLTGVDAGSLNLLIFKQSDADIRTALKEGIRFFDDAELPFTVLFPENTAPQFTAILRDEGLAAAYDTIAMHLAMKDFVAKTSVNDGFDIRCTNDCLNDWALPLESAFESTPALMMQYKLRHLAAIEAQKQLSHFSLYVDNRAVCSLTLSINNSYARLDDIGTDVDFQGQGYATILIQYVLKHIKNNAVSHCFLDASSQGASIYRKAGFSTLFNYAAFQRV